MQRPSISTVSSPDDVTDWYWTVAELRQIARRLGIPSSGTKSEVTERLRAGLAGEPLPGPKPGRRAAGGMQEPLSRDSVVPAGQRMTRQVRDFMVAQIGPDFRFDAAMREFFADPAGRTLGDAVDLWFATRGQRPPIAGQFEYNRFTRQFWAEHPDGTREQLRSAWERYKAVPVSQRRAGSRSTT